MGLGKPCQVLCYAKSMTGQSRSGKCRKRTFSPSTLGSIIVAMPRNVIHVSDEEAAGKLASLLDCVSEGAEVVIERNSRPVAVVRAPEAPHGRLLSESIVLAKAHAKALGYEPEMDTDFAADFEKIVNEHRKPLSPPTWD